MVTSNFNPFSSALTLPVLSVFPELTPITHSPARNGWVWRHLLRKKIAFLIWFLLILQTFLLSRTDSGPTSHRLPSKIRIPICNGSNVLRRFLCQSTRRLLGADKRARDQDHSTTWCIKRILRRKETSGLSAPMLATCSFLGRMLSPCALKLWDWAEENQQRSSK